MTLNLEAIKARCEPSRVAMSEFCTVFPDVQESLADILPLVAEVERLRKVESAAREYRSAHVKASECAHLGKDAERAWDLRIDAETAMFAALDAAQGGG